MYQSTYEHDITSDMYRNVASMPHNRQQLHMTPVPMSPMQQGISTMQT